MRDLHPTFCDFTMLLAGLAAFTALSQAAVANASPADDILACEALSIGHCPALLAATKQAEPARSGLIAIVSSAQTADEKVGKAAMALSLIGGDSVREPIWLAAQAHRQPASLYAQLLAAAGRTGDDRAVAPLVELVNDGDTRARLLAIGALSVLKAPESVAALIATMGNKERHGRVRAAAARALGMIGDLRAEAPLVEVAGAADIYTPARSRAMAALARMKSAAAIPVATQLVDHPARSVGRPALALLAAVPTPWARPAIRFGLATPGLRGEAAKAAVAMGLSDLGPIVLATAGADDLAPDEQTWVLDAVIKLKPVGAAATLVKRLTHVGVAQRIDLLKTIGRLGDRTVVPTLVPLLRSEPRDVANYVVYALETLTDKQLGLDETAWRVHAGLEKPAVAPHPPRAVLSLKRAKAKAAP